MSSTESPQDGTFPAGSVERVLDERRSISDAVESLFRVHIDKQPASSIDLETVEAALQCVNYTVVLVADTENGTEYLACTTGDGDQPNWYSLTEYDDGRTVGPTALYRHNVADRLVHYPISAAKQHDTQYAAEELGAHDLDADADEVVVDV